MEDKREQYTRGAGGDCEVGMRTSNSFKRRLLRAAVQDNVNVIQDNWLHLMPRNQSRRPAWFSGSVVFLVTCALSSLFYAVTMVPESRRPVVVPSSPPTVRQATVGGTGVSLGSLMSTTFPDGVRRNGGASFASSRTDRLIDPETLVSVPQAMDLRALALPVRTIVIDPGHGGDDPGAVTAHGLTEKELALDIGLRLRDLFVASSFAVRMTREKDQTVPLGQRVVLANRAEGDLFVSIHLKSHLPLLYFSFD